MRAVDPHFASIYPLMRELSARPAGFNASDMRDYSEDHRGRALRKGMREGWLHAARLSHKVVCYFDDAERAAVYERKHARLSQPNARKKAVSLGAWKATNAVVPSNVKVQVLPGYTGDRWAVKAPAYGFAAMGIGRYYS